MVVAYHRIRIPTGELGHQSFRYPVPVPEGTTMEMSGRVADESGVQGAW